MSALLIDEGLTQLLRMRNNDAGNAPSKVRLFTNNMSVTKTKVLADFTEMSGMGYTEKTISVPGDWSYALDSGTHKVTGTCNKSWTFSAGAGATIYGWYLVTSNVTPKVCMAETFSSPVTIPAGGGSLALTINDAYGDCSS